jgi:hypothetical protein
MRLQMFHVEHFTTYKFSDLNFRATSPRALPPKCSTWNIAVETRLRYHSNCCNRSEI